MADSEKIEINLRVLQRVVTLKIQPELEPYFRNAATFVNQRLNFYMKKNEEGDMDFLDFLIIVAIEGVVENQKNQDKYLLLQQDLDKRLEDLSNRLTLN
ncbi:cell division protein ZapA [Emticicia sp. C21]|jgi:cell division protein ZapA (FtsZ GTPase activity inhibitor)|uniref:cell division protein ZapA n=1 Tax=Emticicia sp. C21 TaxID=2302915 RepID=UPI000E355AB0|nr:cell division protein ZapA [Emticicia sp. C21]RFS13809.1 cell division protein ZapA [Emticicia sp. C21]